MTGTSLFDLLRASWTSLFICPQQGTSMWTTVMSLISFVARIAASLSTNSSFSSSLGQPMTVVRPRMKEGCMAGVAFTPTWFNTQYQNGKTGLLNASIILPVGMTDLSQATWLKNQPFDGLYFDPSIGRGVATWEATSVDPNEQANGAYDVGVGFPKQYVQTYFDPSTDPNAGGGGGGNIVEDAGALVCLLFPLIFVALIIAFMESGLATEVRGVISTGKEADVLLCGYNGAPLAVKVYRLYRTSHRGGTPIKLESAGRLAAHEYDMGMNSARTPKPTTVGTTP